ncbi:MAG: phosphatidylinositol mannoside acyltransferase [Actinobacteria bacterium]|nr:phosphatidylinositol mannoside acyltransferase [Actinomycetota bacterium]
MAPDVVTAAYRAGAFISRTLPWPLADGVANTLSRLAATVSKERRMMVSRHLRRVRPELEGRALRRAVDATFASYARYWVESFRLPKITPAEVDAGIIVEDFHHITDAIEAGTGVVLVLPHLGGWEWAGFWLTTVRQIPTTVVVEAVEPPALFEFFASFRRELGMNIVPLGPSSGTEILRALGNNHVVCLLADRDITGDGIELEMFGELTSIPAGPAMVALRTGAPLITAAVYFEGEHGHRAIVQPPLPAHREGRLRDDVARVTGEMAARLEGLIRRAPDQWHLQQPNWSSDYDLLEAIGKPHPRPHAGPASRPTVH